MTHQLYFGILSSKEISWINWFLPGQFIKFWLKPSCDPTKKPRKRPSSPFYWMLPSKYEQIWWRLADDAFENPIFISWLEPRRLNFSFSSKIILVLDPWSLIIHVFTQKKYCDLQRKDFKMFSGGVVIFGTNLLMKQRFDLGSYHGFDTRRSIVSLI